MSRQTKRYLAPPRLRQHADDTDRRATWIELFFDLVFSVAVAELAARLASGVSLSGLLGFLALFVPIWWSWIGTTFYATRFIDDDLMYRLTTLAQTLAVGGLGITAREGAAGSTAGFAIIYALLRALLVVQYVRVVRAIADARPLAVRYAWGFGLAAMIWAGSAFVPAPARFALWVLGLVVDIGTPISAGRIHSDLAPDDAHLPERFGLLTLVVLGETMALVVFGVGETPLTPLLGVASALAVALAFALAWLYFANLDGSAIRAARAEGRIVTYQVWLYAHLPLAAAITTLGVGVEYALKRTPSEAMGAPERWLLGGSAAVCLFALGVIHWTSAPPEARARDAARARLRWIGALVIAAFTLLAARAVPVVAIGFLALVCCLLIAIDVRGEGGIAADRADEGIHEGVKAE